MLAAAAGADWRPIAVAVLLVLVDRALMAYRWIALLCTLDRRDRPPLGALLRIFFVSTFVGTLSAGSVGGDAVRAYSLAQAERPRRRRGGVGLHGPHARRRVAAADGAGRADAGPRAGRATGRLSRRSPPPAALCAADAAADLQPRGRPRLAARCCRDGCRRGGQSTPATALLESIQRYAAYHAQLVNVLACSVAVQVLRIVQAYYLGRGLGIDAPLDDLFRRSSR